MRINREILRLSVPSILANITVPLVGMVDIAVVGHLGASADSGSVASSAMTAGGTTVIPTLEAGGTTAFSIAALIGGIAIGTMLFDLLYWNFGFLRVGTGGLAAQAFGRDDMRECSRIFIRAMGISLVSALLLIAVQWLVVQFAFLFVKCTPEVRDLASQYFYIRIWAAPATLALMAFKGWFIGMQDSISPMVTDLTVNVVNIVASIVLALGINIGGEDLGIHWAGMGFRGVAVGTVAAQYSGLLCALLFLLLKYRRKVFAGLSAGELRESFSVPQMKALFSMNADIFVRSLCFIAIYIGFTVISARYGDTLLASCSIMMKLMMIFSYFTDGFAYAGEALTGRCIGARDASGLRLTINWVFIWCIGLAAVFILIYASAGVPMLKMMTSDTDVIEASKAFLPWLVLMPVVGCAAFCWDGIFIGATDTKGMRNAMLWSVAAFVCIWCAGIPFGLSPVPAVHLLMAAYMAHLLARTIYLSVRYSRVPWRAVSQGR